MQEKSRKQPSQKNETSEQMNKNSSETPPLPASPKTEFRSWRAIFQLRSAGYPWKTATRVALSMGVPLLIGAFLGDLSMGLLAAMGGMAAVYVNQEPYLQRAQRLLLIVIGFALSLGLGILAGSNVWLTAFVIGTVAMVAFFVCETWEFPKPSGYFFILVCAIGTGLPVGASQATPSALIAVVGGLWAWALAMAGGLLKPRGPEMEAVRDAYLEVAGFLAKAGTADAIFAQHNAMVALRQAQKSVQAAEMRRIARTGKTARLRQLVNQANALYLAGIELSAEANGRLTSNLSDNVRALADTIEHPEKAASMQISEPAKYSPARLRIQQELEFAVSVAEKETYETNQKIHLQRQSLIDMLKSALSRQSLIGPISLRMGITLVAATFIAVALGSDRPYWVPLTCAAVLNGASTATIFHRSIQRAVGTGVGIILGAVLLTLQSNPYMIAVLIMMLQFCIQFAIIRNYGFGVTFITPLALLMAESGRPGIDVASLISDRLFDTLTGCVIGLLGGLLLWRRASSVRLPVLLSKLIQREGEVLQRMLTNPDYNQGWKYTESLEDMRRKVETALINVRSVYDMAAGEPKRKRQGYETRWPTVVAAQRIGYLVIAGSKYTQGNYLGNEQLQQLKTLFKQLRYAARYQQNPDKDLQIPVIKAYPTIEKELHMLYDGLQM
ncbi:FUSC family protein [Lentibacillus sp. N15]|uniref:FUSC family protein n=1 Tax=Lentibacillus songyuanensis TaxID=3136161 RepID=UPI0031BBC66D